MQSGAYQSRVDIRSEPYPTLGWLGGTTCSPVTSEPFTIALVQSSKSLVLQPPTNLTITNWLVV